MSDDLIARLRRPTMGRSTILEAADALEAKDKRIAHLEEMFNGWRDEARKADARIAELEHEVQCWHEAASWPEKSPQQLRARIATLEEQVDAFDMDSGHAAERIKQLLAALKPFADAADELEDKQHGAIWESPAAMCITANDLRNCQILLDSSRAARAAMEGKDG